MKIDITLDKQRFIDMKNYGYNWYGMYPVESHVEYYILSYFFDGEGLYMIFPDDSESKLDMSDSEALENSKLAVDISEHLYHLYEEKFNKTSFSEFTENILYDFSVVEKLIEKNTEEES